MGVSKYQGIVNHRWCTRIPARMTGEEFGGGGQWSK